MNNEALLKTIEELIKENKKLKFINKIFIIGIKNMKQNNFEKLPTLLKERYKKDCDAILRVAKAFEYKFDGLKAEEIIEKIFEVNDNE